MGSAFMRIFARLDFAPIKEGVNGYFA